MIVDGDANYSPDVGGPADGNMEDGSHGSSGIRRARKQSYVGSSATRRSSDVSSSKMMSKAAPDTINEEGEGHAQIEAEVNDNDNGKGKTKDIANGAAAENERTEDDAKVDADGDTEVKVNAEAPPSLVLPPPDVKDTQPSHDDSGSKADGTVAAAAAIGGGPAATEKWLGATSPEERASTARALFSEIRDVKLYLCTDILLVATHERVSTIWGRAQEHVKAALQDAPPVRTTTIDDDGVETIHKVTSPTHYLIFSFFFGCFFLFKKV